MSAGDKPAWSATAAHLRAVVAGVVLAAVALIGPRVDMAILAAPFVAAATYGAMRRPRQVLGVHLRVDATTLAEGQATSARVIVTGDGEDGSILAVEITADRWTQCKPAGAARVVIVNPPSSEVSVDVRPVRWGRHELRARDVTVTSPLGAFRTVTTPRSVVVTTLPLAEMFAATDALPRPAALVGLHRSRRQGEGSELAEVRAFRPGDRLRRINWPVSSRVGVLHVTAAWSDRDTEVVLLLDTEHDLGISDGVDGRASSLDVAVRAAAAIADHYVRAGDRVSLTDLGARIRSVPAGGGRQHLRRLLDVLVAAVPSRIRAVDPGRLRRVRTGSLVIAFSPLLGGAGVAQVVALVRRGHAVVVIDTLPDSAFAADASRPWRTLAWRVRLLERAVEIDRLGELGVPVVKWRGRGTLDEVLRDVSRMSSAPRIR